MPNLHILLVYVYLSAPCTLCMQCVKNVDTYSVSEKITLYSHKALHTLIPELQIWD